MLNFVPAVLFANRMLTSVSRHPRHVVSNAAAAPADAASTDKPAAEDASSVTAALAEHTVAVAASAGIEEAAKALAELRVSDAASSE